MPGVGNTPSQEIIWRGMTRAQLDAAYNNTAAVKNSTEKLVEWGQRSSALRTKLPELLDLRYGPRDRNRIDVFRSGQANAPLFVFIHGGYWQNYTKEDLAFIAHGPLAHGFNVALAEYTLAPQASMTQIVGEIRSLLDHLAATPLVVNSQRFTAATPRSM